ncbi:MAG: GldG family protein [Bacteriovoracaceae bacterium]|nr:GldG family protein [Bacteriovoracaceae bacterium]
MNKQKETYFDIILSILIMIFIIYIGSTLGKRAQLDLTSENLYTLSKGTKAILKKINAKIDIKLYYSKTAANQGSEGIRYFNTYYNYVRDLLEEYEGLSNNKISLQVIDPRPDTKEEEDAIRAGLKRFPLTQTEQYFFGLVATNENGTEKIIEFFDPQKQSNLEYDLTKLIYSSTNPKKKTVGILSSLEVLNDKMSPYMIQMMKMQGKSPPTSWIITEMMKEFYNVKKVMPTETEFIGIDILLVIHPKSFSEALQFAIDQFVLKGGKLIVLADPHSIIDQTSNKQQQMMMGATPPTNSNLAKLFNTWGVDLRDNQFAGDKYLSGMGRLDRFSPPARILPLLNCDKRCTSESKDTMTSSLNKLTFLYPGALNKLNPAATNISALITTTDKGNVYLAQGFERNNPKALMSKFKEGVAPVVIAYKIIGKFKSAFPDGIKVSENQKDDKKDATSTMMKHITGLKESKRESAIIVVADVDFIHDQFAFQQSIFGTAVANDNSAFLLNALENLTGSNDLMSVRSKGKFSRSFVRIDAIEFEAEKRTEGKVQEINANIARFTQEMQSLGGKGKSQALIRNEVVKKKKQLMKKIAQLKSQLRDVKREGREEIEKIGKGLQYINILVIPIIVTILGIILGIRRVRRRQLTFRR